MGDILKKPQVIADHPKQHILTRIIISGLVLLLILSGIVVAWFVVGPGKKPVDPEAKKKTEAILNTTAAIKKTRTVSSGMGFEVPYDLTLFNAEGFVSNTAETKPGYVSGETFSDAELDVKRNYTLLKLSQKPSSTVEVVDSLQKSELAIATNFHKNFFDQKTKLPENKDKSQLDILLEGEKTKVSPEEKVIAVNKVTVKDKEFYKIVIERVTELFDTKEYEYTYKYITVNDNSPYWFTISGIKKGANEGDVQLYEAVILETKFTKHDENSVVRSGTGVKLASDVKNVTKGTSKEQGYVSSDDEIRIIAKNQIATIRVGVINCADMSFTSENGKNFVLKNGCTAGIGSGSIVSSDGYVVTNGHVVHSGLKQLAQYGLGNADSATASDYIQFIIDAGYVTRADLQSYRERYENGDKEASAELAAILQKVPESGISISNKQTYIDLQLSDTPMALADIVPGSRLAWAPRKGNTTDVKLLAYEVDQTANSFNISSTFTDVAVLKIQNGSYPTVSIGNSAKMREGDSITTIGYPAVADDGLDTKERKTVPSVSQGLIDSVGIDAGGHKLFAMSAQIAAGNSGGPAFDQEGKQVGINTYGGSPCSKDSNDNRCFGRGIARDIADAQAFMKKNNVSISGNNELSDLWEQGINQFMMAEYSDAATTFDSLNKKYPNNYLVAKFLTASKEQVAANSSANEPAKITSESSTRNSLVIIASILGVLCVTLFGVAGYMIVSHRRSQPIAVASSANGSVYYPPTPTAPQVQHYPPVQAPIVQQTPQIQPPDTVDNQNQQT